MLASGVDQRIVIGLIQKLDPAIIDVAQNAIKFSIKFAEDWLSSYMLKGNPSKAKKIAKDLADNQKWLSHGKRIGIKEAQNLGLAVKAIPRNSKLWKSLWEYYARAQVAVNARGTLKLFECAKASEHFTVGPMQRPAGQPKK